MIDDKATKEEIGAAVKEGMAAAFANKPAGMDGVQSRMYAGAEHLANSFPKLPAWILGCGRRVYPPQAPSDVFLYSTVYPAAQNLIVAARSMDIGACFTTFQMTVEPVIRKVCRIPQDVQLCVFVAIGYPERRFMPVQRKPVESVLHWNTF